MITGEEFRLTKENFIKFILKLIDIIREVESVHETFKLNHPQTNFMSHGSFPMQHISLDFIDAVRLESLNF